MTVRLNGDMKVQPFRSQTPLRDLVSGLFANKLALFGPSLSPIVAKTLEPYTNLGYQLVSNSAVLPPKVNPFALGKPVWAKQRTVECRPA